MVDTTPPDTSITSQPPDPTNSGNASIVYIGTDNSGTGIAGYQCKLDAAAFASCPANPQTYTGLADGSHTFQVRAIDNVGNIDPTPAVCTWVVDTAAPTVTIDQAGSQADPTTVSPVVFRAVFSENIAAGFTDGDVTLSGTAGATTAHVTEIAPFDGTTFSVAVDGMTGPGSVIATIAAGVAQDAAGNSNAASTSTDNVVTFTVDTVTTITSDLPDPSTAGDAVTVNYTVTASLGMPSGSVTVADSVSGANCTATIAVGTCDIVLTGAGTHTLTATYAGSGGYNGSSDTESHEVIDPPSVQFSSSTYMEDESQVATITIVRTGDKSGTDIVLFSTANGTATGGTTCSSAIDYVSVTDQPVVFDPSEATKTVNVAVCADWLTEPDQTVDLSLTGTHVGSPGTAVLTINDTATRFRSETPVIINQNGSASPYPSTITVGGAPNIIGSMRVTLYDLSAELPDDVDVLLVGPNGREFVLMSDAGGLTPIDSSSTVTLNFTDWAGAVLPDSGALTTRDFEPTSWLPVADFPAPAPAGPYNEPGYVLGGSGLQTLAGNFDGSDANGDWNLYVRNDSTGAPVPVGSFAGGWGLEFYAPTAANASISGRVLTAGGVSIRNARVMVSGNSLPQPRVVTTGSFGYFTFEDLTVGETYVVTVNSQRYTFQTPSRVISLVDNIVDADFVAN